MPVHTAQLQVSTAGDNDIVDITRGVEEVVATAGIDDGAVNVFVAHSTAAITTIEYEPGAVEDLKRAVEQLAPASASYEHNRRAGDDNGHAHVRAALVGPSETLPVREGHLIRGTWQQVVLIDFDTRSRQRTVTVQVLS